MQIWGQQVHLSCTLTRWCRLRTDTKTCILPIHAWPQLTKEKERLPRLLSMQGCMTPSTINVRVNRVEIPRLVFSMQASVFNVRVNWGHILALVSFWRQCGDSKFNHLGSILKMDAVSINSACAIHPTNVKDITTCWWLMLLPAITVFVVQAAGNLCFKENRHHALKSGRERKTRSNWKLK